MNTRSHPATVGWFEITAADPERSREFYRGIFGWEFTPHGEAYETITAAGAGASMGALRRGERDALVIHVGCPDLAAALQHLESLGAKVDEPPGRSPAGDRRAVFTDVLGNRLGLIESADRPRPAPGAGVDYATAWFEIGTTDFPVTREFYETAFDWTCARDEAAEGVVYYSILPGGSAEAIGGVFDLSSMPGATDYAIPGLRVPDVADVLERCEKAGGSPVLGPVSDANGVTIGQFTDPSGNRWSSFAVPPGG